MRSQPVCRARIGVKERLARAVRCWPERSASAPSVVGHARSARPKVAPVPDSGDDDCSRVSTKYAVVRRRAALVTLKLDRAKTILGYSAKYQIPADLAAAIYDIALRKASIPSWRSGWSRSRATSSPDAKSSMMHSATPRCSCRRRVSTTPLTRRSCTAGREPAHRVPFPEGPAEAVRHDYELALLAYNRGPGKVAEILAQGGDPKNGYSEAVLKGYRPPRTVAGDGAGASWR